MNIYKILRSPEWAALQEQGATGGSPLDVTDGYIHFSTAEQVEGTLTRHFAGLTGLVLLTLDGDALGAALAWEPSRGGALFPHLYGPLRLADVRAVNAIPLIDGAHQLPLLS
jgi:uncharacterized protein (DUF952 family)